MVICRVGVQKDKREKKSIEFSTWNTFHTSFTCLCVFGISYVYTYNLTPLLYSRWSSTQLLMRLSLSFLAMDWRVITMMSLLVSTSKYLSFLFFLSMVWEFSKSHAGIKFVGKNNGDWNKDIYTSFLSDGVNQLTNYKLNETVGLVFVACSLKYRRG